MAFGVPTSAQPPSRNQPSFLYHFGVFWGLIMAHLGPLWSPLNRPWTHFGRPWGPCGRPAVPFWAPSGNPGGPNTAPGLHFGRFGVPFWLILGPCLSISVVFWGMLASFQSLALVSHNSRPCSTTYSPDPKNSLGRTSSGIHSSLSRTP